MKFLLFRGLGPASGKTYSNILLLNHRRALISAAPCQQGFDLRSKKTPFRPAAGRLHGFFKLFRRLRRAASKKVKLPLGRRIKRIVLELGSRTHRLPRIARLQALALDRLYRRALTNFTISELSISRQVSRLGELQRTGSRYWQQSRRTLTTAEVGESYARVCLGAGKPSNKRK